MNVSLLRRALAVAGFFSIVGLAACGGGGGGGTSSSPAAPVASAPAGPAGPTTSPSTPAPGSSPAQPQGNTILPSTTGRFGLAQLVDNYGPAGAGALSSSVVQQEAPNYNAVWATFPPDTALWSQYHTTSPAMILSQYVVPFEDDYMISGCNLQCWESGSTSATNAPNPTWIMFACNSSGQPTTYNPWSTTGFANDVPLNIHNPAAVNYEIENIILPYIQSHPALNAIAIDQVTFENFLEAPNPELGEGSAQPGNYYDCGYYSQWNNGSPVAGSFQYVYGGPGENDFDQPDSTFINDLLNWVQTAKSDLASYNIKVLVNHPPTGATPSGNEETLLNSVDGVLDEQGFTDYGQFGTQNPSLFTNTISWTQAVQGMNKAVFLADYFCQSSSGCNASSASGLSQGQVEYALATYAMANAGGLDLYVAGYGVDEPSYRPEFSDTYGASCGAMTQPSSNLYMERFQGGLAVVNASPSSPQTVTLPSNHTYTDIESGATVPATYTLGPSQASMLLTTGNGCS